MQSKRRGVMGPSFFGMHRCLTGLYAKGAAKGENPAVYYFLGLIGLKPAQVSLTEDFRLKNVY